MKNVFVFFFVFCKESLSKTDSNNSAINNTSKSKTSPISSQISYPSPNLSPAMIPIKNKQISSSNSLSHDKSISHDSLIDVYDDYFDAVEEEEDLPFDLDESEDGQTLVFVNNEEKKYEEILDFNHNRNNISNDEIQDNGRLQVFQQIDLCPISEHPLISSC